MSSDGLSYSHAMSLGAADGGDYSRELERDRTTRATARAIATMHERALAGLAAVVMEAQKHYSPRDSAAS